MKVTAVDFVISLFVMTYACGENDCTLVADGDGVNNLHESTCYLKCLSDALNKLYSNGERRLFVNEEVYANASRILDYMEWKSGESTKYLSVIGGVMEGKDDKLEKLISYGNAMGDLVAKVGGLFAEVNESVRAMRKKLPDALIKANKYYTAISEITRTVWDDVKALEIGDTHKCEDKKILSVKAPAIKCGEHTCALTDGVNDSTLKLYRKGCMEVTVLSKSGAVSECFNLPRDKLYKSGAVNDSRETFHWRDHGDKATYFKLKIQVRSTFGPLALSFAAGQPPSALLAMMSNITSLYSHFNLVHGNFTSVLDSDVTENVSSTNFTVQKTYLYTFPQAQLFIFIHAFVRVRTHPYFQ